MPGGEPDEDGVDILRGIVSFSFSMVVMNIDDKAIPEMPVEKTVKTSLLYYTI